jgi:hypothetical protein
MTAIYSKIQGMVGKKPEAQPAFISNQLNFTGLGVSLLINIIHWLILYFKFGSSTSSILLHFNVVYGSNLIQKAQFTYFIPAVALILLILNFFLARFFFKKESLAANFILLSSIVVQLIFLAASLVIVVVNS